MLDPAGLAGALGPVAALLAPVVALLFVAIRLRKRLRYPHDLLSPRDDRKPAAALFRSLRLYYDAAIDAACAVIIGLAVAGYPEPKPRLGPATVLDASLSMLSGMRGDRPLDEAARLLLSDGSFRSSTVFALGWDPATRVHSLRDVTKPFRAAESPQELAASLESSEAFMSADYALIAELAGRGYGPVAFITDDAAAAAGGADIEVRTLSAKPPRYLLPASAAWDDDRGRSVVRFIAVGGAGIEALWELSADGTLSRAKPEDYAISGNPAGFELSFAGGGLWAAQWDGRVLPFEAPGRPEPLRADGPFAVRVVGALGAIGAPDAAARQNGSGVIVRDGRGADVPGFLSVAMAETEPAVLPPRLTLGTVVAAGVDRRADLSLGRAAVASPETAVAFWVSRAAGGAEARQEAAAAKERRARPIRVGEGFLYPARQGRAAYVVVPPPGEYAPSGRRTPVPAGSPPGRRLPVALALAALFGLKAWLGRRLGRGSKSRSGLASAARTAN